MVSGIVDSSEYARLSEREQLALAVSDDLEARFMLAGLETLPLSVQLVLITDPDDGVRGSIASLRYRDRLAVQLAEQRETSPAIRQTLAVQANASVSLKRNAPVRELFEDAVQIALDDLELPPERQQTILEQWRTASRQDGDETFGQLLDRV